VPFYTCAQIHPCLAGVAKGVTHCGAESPSIRDPTTWSIKISKVLLYTSLSAFTVSKSNVLVCIIDFTRLAKQSHEARSIKLKARQTSLSALRSICLSHAKKFGNWWLCLLVTRGSSLLNNSCAHQKHYSSWAPKAHERSPLVKPQSGAPLLCLA